MIKNIQKYIKAEYITIFMLTLLSLSLLFLLGQKKEMVESPEINEIRQLEYNGNELKQLELHYRAEWEKTIWAKRCNEARLKDKINSGSTVIDCTNNLEKWASYNNREQGL